MKEHCRNLERIFNLIERKRISIVDNNIVRSIYCKNIVRAEAWGSYTHIYLIDNRKITMSGNIKKLQNKLPDCIFFRIHRSHLINMLFVDKLDNTDNTIYMPNNTSLPLAKENKTAYKKQNEILEG